VPRLGQTARLGELPPGLVYQQDFLSTTEEQRLIELIDDSALSEVRFRGFVAKRQVAHFGYDYAYDARQIKPGPAIPEELAPLIARAAAVASRPATDFAEVLLTRYSDGAGIGWHRDAPSFGEPVVGISLGAMASLRLRRRGESRASHALSLAPRSLYLLGGPSRWDFEHQIPAISGLRYSITLRVLRRNDEALLQR
jgi:DNA oxidative demethylase